jgi:hypothetical protein
MERYNMNKLNEERVKISKYQVKVSNGFASLINVEVNISRTWETIKKNVKISANASLGYY